MSAPTDISAEPRTDAAPGPDDPVLFAAFLHPNRSLSRTGFLAVMGTVIVVSTGVGGFFLASGAWPVFGFYGLDVLLIYLALRANYRSGRIYERVRLTGDEFKVEKGDHRGPHFVWTAKPYWLRVSMDDPPRHESQIRLSSHGKSLVIGAFLSPEERADFARALAAALDGARKPVHPDTEEAPV